MKIAVTYWQGEIFQHFGHTPQFKIYEVENGKVVSAQVIDTGSSVSDLLGGSENSALSTFVRRTSGGETGWVVLLVWGAAAAGVGGWLLWRMERFARRARKTASMRWRAKSWRCTTPCAAATASSPFPPTMWIVCPQAAWWA